ncbi:hypothetical protein ACJMK2_029359 [Sinanodonta woodiana]|uniref:NADH dehydrogenase [ubiquinone] 1 beta subcomplex subunit 2, mitochondrial n=1 Tax=Sinanodonta woodiana TaxID=1069815 RepID=A0ABD3X9N1_SINWO
MFVISRLRPLASLMRTQRLVHLNSVRHSGGWQYRSLKSPDSKPHKFAADALFFFMWYWIMYRFWREPELFLGHFRDQWPNPSKWTDEELGIPPEDEDN